MLVQVFCMHYTKLCEQKHNITLRLVTVKAIILLKALFKKPDNISEVWLPLNSFVLRNQEVYIAVLEGPNLF